MVFQKKFYGKVISTLEEKKINYLIIDPRNNYDVDEKSDNKNLNTYENELEKAYLLQKQKNKINTNSYDILELSYEANSIDDIKIKLQILQKIMAKIKVIDFLLNLALKKEMISKKAYLKLARFFKKCGYFHFYNGEI